MTMFSHLILNNECNNFDCGYQKEILVGEHHLLGSFGRSLISKIGHPNRTLWSILWCGKQKTLISLKGFDV
jgi:hypothetical protein